jgi:hypothetical protein
MVDVDNIVGCTPCIDTPTDDCFLGSCISDDIADCILADKFSISACVILVGSTVQSDPTTVTSLS